MGEGWGEGAFTVAFISAICLLFSPFILSAANDKSQTASDKSHAQAKQPVRFRRPPSEFRLGKSSSPLPPRRPLPRRIAPTHALQLANPRRPPLPRHHALKSEIRMSKFETSTTLEIRTSMPGF